MLSSEKSIKRPSSTPFSSKLAQACIQVSILKCQLAHLQYHTDKSESINILQSRLHQPIHLPTSLNELKRTLKNLRKEVRIIRKASIAFRDEHLQVLSLDQNITKIIKRIRQIETLKRSFAKIKYTINPNHYTMITHLEVPTDNTPPKQATSWHRLTDPEAIKSRLIQRNINHFGSAQGTPWTVPPLSTDFSWDTTSPAHKNTLDGNPPEHDDPMIKELLTRLKRRIAPTTPTITLAEFIKRLRRWKESTTTSPSRRHLGHYKALLPPSTCPLDEYKSTLAGEILLVHLALLNFCATSGHSLKRWHTIITMTIPKQPNNFKIHKLRVIHIYEADLTAISSIWSRRMVQQHYKNESINPGSYGARPG